MFAHFNLFYIAVSTGIINCISVKLSARTHILFTVLKVAGLLMIIIGGLIKILKGRNYFVKLNCGVKGYVGGSTAEVS